MDSDNAFVMHVRPFKNTSALVDFFTQNHGMLTILAKGIKRPRSHQHYLVQPFMPLKIHFMGKGELKTLTQIDSEKSIPILQGKSILLGMYLNELIVKLLEWQDAHPVLFQDYFETIVNLAKSSDMRVQQTLLRQFEIKLLAELGYGIDLLHDGKTHLPIEKELLYSYAPQIGLYESSSQLSNTQISVSGANILAFAKNEILSEHALLEIKRLMRSILSVYLGNKSIESRKLFPSPITHE